MNNLRAEANIQRTYVLTDNYGKIKPPPTISPHLFQLQTSENEEDMVSPIYLRPGEMKKVPKGMINVSYIDT